MADSAQPQTPSPTPAAPRDLLDAAAALRARLGRPASETAPGSQEGTSGGSADTSAAASWRSPAGPPQAQHADARAQQPQPSMDPAGGQAWTAASGGSGTAMVGAGLGAGAGAGADAAPGLAPPDATQQQAQPAASGTQPPPASPASPASSTSPASASAAAAAHRGAPARDVSQQAVIDQVVKHLAGVRAMNGGATRTVLHLAPAHLGSLTLTVDVRAGSVRLDLAGNEAALSALRSGLTDLRTDLSRAGLDLADVSLRDSSTDADTTSGGRQEGFGARQGHTGNAAERQHSAPRSFRQWPQRNDADRPDAQAPLTRRGGVDVRV